ncbi:hypothetical protein BpHYR1_007014, partial [Brachionus plicatilis]
MCKDIECIKNSFFEPVSTKEITSAIKRLKEEASSGPDQIHNLLLKNVPQNILKDIMYLFSLSLRE